MTRPSAPGRPPAAWPMTTQWAVLLALSAVLVLALEGLHIPAALLLGPMGAAIALAVLEGTVRVPPWPFMLAQGVIGCMIARSLQPAILHEMVRDWPLFLGGVVSVMLVSTVLGWLLARWQVLPGTTALWGSSPGAASVMVLMAGAFGADIRLVAFMQYLRVMCVALCASLVARLWTTGGGHPPAIDWFPPLPLLPFGETLALVAGGVVLARRLPIPAGPLLVPLVLGTLLQDTGAISLTLPPWLLAASYTLVGWSIGLRFTRAILLHAARATPRVLGAIAVLIALCGGLAALLVRLAHVDPLTAYLATSPGGADSVAIIAFSSHVDVPFVMGMQMVRFVVVLLAMPAITRLLARRMT
ncbi:AbrB family transcriptional regulator [Gluconacetobacter azotocaptans]|uniref:AbrB family transcriptional regulator n=2 Tax=Gluconacetobacter azotocaptans TaxID=142834 RepID=A0A7W4JPH0_9PROT|nr:AbrB family transcriptional regulator [Gluconacetobacter azotocaptans]